MTDPIAWLHRQLDADEQAVIRYRDGHPDPHVNVEGDDPADYTPHDSCARCLAAAEATPYQDAEFGLRQIRAHRALLDTHGFEEEASEGQPAFRYCLTCGSGEPHEYPTQWPCGTLRVIASVYADRDGYAAMWRPDE